MAVTGLVFAGMSSFEPPDWGWLGVYSESSGVFDPAAGPRAGLWSVARDWLGLRVLGSRSGVEPLAFTATAEQLFAQTRDWGDRGDGTRATWAFRAVAAERSGDTRWAGSRSAPESRYALRTERDARDPAAGERARTERRAPVSPWRVADPAPVQAERVAVAYQAVAGAPVTRRGGTAFDRDGAEELAEEFPRLRSFSARAR